jgi:hypothetical protein
LEQWITGGAVRPEFEQRSYEHEQQHRVSLFCRPRNHFARFIRVLHPYAAHFDYRVVAILGWKHLFLAKSSRTRAAHALCLASPVLFIPNESKLIETVEIPSLKPLSKLNSDKIYLCSHRW